MLRLAQASADERAWLRERWQRLPTEERDRLRRELREEWPSLPPELRNRQRRELLDRVEQRTDKQDRRKSDRYEPEAGFGQGFGTRIWDDPEYDDRRRDRR